MTALVQITAWHYVAFVCCILILVGVDLGLFHKRAHQVKSREALLWSAIWVGLAVIFALGLRWFRSEQEALEFSTGYLIELSLSMDNVFVMALIFAYFRVPPEHQHRVLYWGVLGALLMRGLMIALGLTLVSLLHWVFYLFGAFLLYNGFRMVFVNVRVEPEKNLMIRLARKFCPVSPKMDGQKFLTRLDGRRALTPLALVLLMVEATDLLFAVDSIPAVFAVTTKPFIVFTSNIFAILGLRSLYFVLADAIAYFRYLKYGLALVLIFIGMKMLLNPPEPANPFWFQIQIPISVSLAIVGGIIAVSIGLSVIATRREQRPSKSRGEP